MLWRTDFTRANLKLSSLRVIRQGGEVTFDYAGAVSPNLAQSRPLISPNLAQSGPISPNLAQSHPLVSTNLAQSRPISPPHLAPISPNLAADISGTQLTDCTFVRSTFRHTDLSNSAIEDLP